jgi:hypothetical protein
MLCPLQTRSGLAPTRWAGSDTDREALLELGAMNCEERQQYPAVTAQARAQGEVVELEAAPIEPGERSGEEPAPK